MELTEGRLLKTLEFVIRRADTYKTLPFKWNLATNRIELKSKTALGIYKKWVAFSCICTSLILVQVIWTWNGASMFVKSLSLEFFSAFIMTFPSCYVNTKIPNIVAGFANKLIAFENRQSQLGGQLHNWLTKNIGKPGRWFTNWVTRMSVLSMFSMLPFQLNALVEPCFPVYFGFWLVDNCQVKLGPMKMRTNWDLREFLMRLGLTILSYTNWSFLVPSMIVHICLMMLQGHCIRSYIRYYTT